MIPNNLHIISNKRQNKILLICCVLALGLFYVFGNHLKTFKREHINSDVTEYYSFVTAAFECHDLSFDSGCPQRYWAQVTPEGKLINKRSIGMAYMYTPFYGLSKAVAFLSGNHHDGYSKQTQKMLVIGIWIYVCIGLFFLGKALFHFFSTPVVVSTLAVLVASTNLIWYTNGEALFTHGVNFMWLSILIYATIKYHQNFKVHHIVVISLSISMLAVIRPNNILLGLIPVLYGISNIKTLKEKLTMVQKYYSHILLAFVVFLIPIIPQFIYWKFATGHWVYYSYQGEKFYWFRPLIMEVLFSFRKGWLIYTPVMALAILGLFYVKRQARPLAFPVLFIFPVFLYVTSCWWAWSYGGCFGLRPMIDIYALLAFPFAACLSNKRWFAILPIFIFIASATWLNIVQAKQYSEGILHYDQMNWKTYKAIWRKNKYPNEYDLLVAYPDYLKELTGRGAYYNLNELTEGDFSIKFIRAKFVCSTADSLGILQAVHQDASDCDAFNFKYNYFDQTFIIRSCKTGNVLRWNKLDDCIYPDGQDLMRATPFKLISLGENKFAMKAPNGMYVTSVEPNQYHLKADALELKESAYMVIRKYKR